MKIVQYVISKIFCVSCSVVDWLIISSFKVRRQLSIKYQFDKVVYMCGIEEERFENTKLFAKMMSNSKYDLHSRQSYPYYDDVTKKQYKTVFLNANDI